MAGLEPKFILKEPNSEKKTLIYLYLNWKRERVKISISEWIKPSLWDNEEQRPTEDKKLLRSLKPLETKEIRILSHRLDEIEFFVKDLILDLKKDKTLSLDIIKEKTLIFLGRKEEKEQVVYFLDYFRQIVKEMEEGTYLTPKGSIFSKGTTRSYKANISTLDQFEKLSGRIKIDNIDMNLYNQILNFCNRSGYKLNTTGALFKRMKAILKHGYENGVHKNDIFRHSGFKAIKENVYNVYLNNDELSRLYNLELFGKNEVYRDVFLIGCYTAQRYSDFSRIIPEFIQTTPKGNKVIDLVQKKTKVRVLIPFIFPELETLLAKYDYRVPSTSEQVMNRYIKNFCQLAEINNEIVLTESIGGKTKTRKEYKYNLVSTHTARRSGATNLFLMGYSSMQSMKITGHTSEESYLQYIKVSLEENIDNMIQVDEG